jgi:hypothetical protein
MITHLYDHGNVNIWHGWFWRRPGECAKFKCVMGDCDDGSIETDIEEYVGKFDNTMET